MNEPSKQVRSLNLPTLLNEGQFRVLIFDAFILLGEELGEHYRNKLEPIYGKNWIIDLARQRNHSPYNLTDPGWVLKEPLRNSTSPTRSTLPKGQGFYNQISLLTKARNAYFHNQGSGTSDAAKEVIQLLLEFALSVPLDFCASEYAEAIRRISKLNAGEDFLGAEKGLERIQALEQQVANLEELANQNKQDIQQREQLLESALDDVAIREEALRELNEKVGDKDQAIASVRTEQEKAAKLVVELQRDYETKVAELADKENLERQYKELLRTLVASNTVSSLKSAAIKKSSTEVKDLKPGSLWPGEKGSRRLTLSVNFRELYDTKTGELLREIHGQEATELAHAWLEIKPQGGRIFVDVYGIATAYRGEDLIYMGTALFLMN
jgi:uncharacterized protein YoxC